MYRALTAGEYIQMSGRAGRRGKVFHVEPRHCVFILNGVKDERGICIMMIDERVDTNTIQDILTGKADPLISR